MNDNKKRAGINPVSFALFIALILSFLWMAGQNQLRKQEMTYPGFCQEVENGNIKEVYIQQNEEVPTGTVIATLADSGATVRVCRMSVQCRSCLIIIKSTMPTIMWRKING